MTVEQLKKKYKELKKWSNPEEAQKKAKAIYGAIGILGVSPLKDKKYRIYNPIKKKYVDFGQFNPPMEDYTKHKDKKRRDAYRARALNIKGNWKKDPFSANNLSVFILW
jgi:hypothetical protein